MSEDWKPYVVQQGDHLQKIAFRRGADPDEVWSHPKNKDLAARRKNKDTLCPGDVLHLPTEPPPGLDIAPGTTNRYSATIPTVPVKVTIAMDGKPVANEAYEVHGMNDGAKPVEGTTSANGEVELEVPVHLREIEIEVPELGLVVPVHIGDLDPIEERSGVVQRLRNLGHLPDDGDVDDAMLSAGIRAFQTAEGLSPDGELSDEVRSAIQTKHGT